MTSRLRFFVARRMALSLALLALFTLIFTVLAVRLSGSGLFAFDDRISSWVFKLVSDRMTPVMKGFTFLGSTVGITLFTIIAIGWMIWRKQYWEPLFLVIAVLGGTAFNHVLKAIFHRERPTLHRLIEQSGYSFPSGHSMESFIFYGMICMLLFVFFKNTRTRALLLLLTALIILSIGVSRIYLGVHYPSDVLAGYCAGGAWLIVCLTVLDMVLDARRKSGKTKAAGASGH